MPRFCGSIRDVRVALVGRGPRGSVASARLGARRFGPGLRVLAHETSCARAVTCLGQGGEGCPLRERPQPAPLQGGVCSEPQGEGAGARLRAGELSKRIPRADRARQSKNCALHKASARDAPVQTTYQQRAEDAESRSTHRQRDRQRATRRSRHARRAPRHSE